MLKTLPDKATPEQITGVARYLIQLYYRQPQGVVVDSIEPFNGGIKGQFKDAGTPSKIFRYEMTQVVGKWVLEYWPIAGVEDEEPEDSGDFAEPDEPDIIDQYTEQVRHQAGPIIARWTEQIRALAEGAPDLPSFAEQLYDLYPELQGAELQEIMERAMLAASLAGAYEAQEGE
ncbi:DUF935 family protein [Synechococcales cyanobacterium C]|uniref:DUF935 family protein n=1 Tax=Petrachloros mirabilis ULC683 TaxID=2781853 RepID=A0A8K1ZZ70_9CYAN|nr:DUF935 family protein [Petrachloros mirabilis]NCJ06668.1 DUF935 family protein [Petrachloros mirabilis ULC683]